MRLPRVLTVFVWLAVPVLPAQFTGFWEVRPSLVTARQEVGAAVLGDRVYVAGGLLLDRSATATVEVFDRATGRWGRIADLPTTLHHFGMCELGGKLYTLGGYEQSFVGIAACRSWDPTTNAWSRIADLPRPRGACVAVTLGGRIYVVGGVVPSAGVVGDLTSYDPATNRWTTLAPMPTAREHLAAAVIGGKLYVAGGRSGGQLYAVLEVYDPATNRWGTLAPMPTARGGNGAAVLEDRLYVVGGEGARIYPEAEQYDPATDRWQRVADMRVPVHGIYPVTLGDEIFVAGGGLVPGYGATAQVTAFRLLPTGVARYGASTPACRGAIVAGVLARPEAGNPGFGFACSSQAPPATGGVLVLGTAPDVPGTVLAGVRVHVALAAMVALLPATTDGGGAARLPLPLPAGTRGVRVFAQLVWANTALCSGPGPFSSTDALDVTVQ